MGTPKALLPGPGGETLLDHLIRCFERCCEPVIVVLGHQPSVIRAGARLLSGVHIAVNEDWQSGQFSSLQCGLHEVPARAAGAAFTPVDHAFVREQTIARLIAEFRRHPDCPAVLAPSYQGRNGHPVCCCREVIAELLAQPADGQARDIIRRRRGPSSCMEVDDPGVITDIDDPAAYARAFEALR